MKTIQKHGDNLVNSLILKLITGRLTESEYQHLSEVERIHLYYRSFIVCLWVFCSLIFFAPALINIVRILIIT